MQRRLDSGFVAPIRRVVDGLFLRPKRQFYTGTQRGQIHPLPHQFQPQIMPLAVAFCAYFFALCRPVLIHKCLVVNVVDYNIQITITIEIGVGGTVREGRNF